MRWCAEGGLRDYCGWVESSQCTVHKLELFRAVDNFTSFMHPLRTLNDLQVQPRMNMCNGISRAIVLYTQRASLSYCIKGSMLFASHHNSRVLDAVWIVTYARK